MAELRRVFEVRMTTELFACFPVEPDMMEEVIPLEDTVLLDHPVVLLRHERLQDSRCDVRVIEAP